MTDREIMQQALNALEYHTKHTYPFHQTNVAMEALRQALAQPEPFKPDWVSYRQGVADGAAQHEQESPHSAKHSADSAEGFGKREWVGLTDDEIKKIMQRWRGEFDIRDIERLLKEKNT